MWKRHLTKLKTHSSNNDWKGKIQMTKTMSKLTANVIFLKFFFYLLLFFYSANIIFNEKNRRFSAVIQKEKDVPLTTPYHHTGNAS
jgi:hypothetical protein